MKTRSKPKSSASKPRQQDSASQPSQPATKTLAPSVSNPPHVFILPKNLSPTARILTLPNPATGTSSRYLIDAEAQRCYEFTRVAGPRKACRSWFLAPASTNVGAEEEAQEEDGFVMEKPDLMIATPIDPLFLVLPALARDIVDGEKGRQMFLSPSDFLERVEESSVHFKALTEDVGCARNLEEMFERRMRAACDSMEVGEEERLYRLSLAKLLEVLCAKAESVVGQSLFPPSMEEKLVKQALAPPVLNVQREESSLSLANEDHATAGVEDDSASSTATSQQDSQSSSTTTTSTSTAATSVLSEEASEPSQPSESKEESRMLHLLRLRTALNYILRSYIPASLHPAIQSLLSQPTPTTIDFTPLTTRLAYLDALKKEAQTLRSLSDNISRKRSAVDEDDAEALERAEAKKRKKEEEEARKKNVSRGVKALEKADRSGMKTLSSFFGAKAVVKKT